MNTRIFHILWRVFPHTPPIIHYIDAVAVTLSHS